MPFVSKANAAFVPFVVYNPAGTLPAGVTLQQIDGGPTYYNDNGFTYAVDAGWDSSSFFSIGPFLAPMLTQSDATRWIDLGLNTAFNIRSDAVMSLYRSNGISVIQNMQDGFLAGSGAETVGLMTYDEASTYALGVSGPLSSTPNATQDGRFWYINNTWNYIASGGLGLSGTPAPGDGFTMLTHPVATPNGTTRHINVSSIDYYFFSNAGDAGILGQIGDMNASPPAYGSPPATADQANRGSQYGDVISQQRTFNGVNQPIFSLVENGGPYIVDTTGASYIQPPELNAAVWSSIIHGARAICYFNSTFGGPANGVQDNFASSYFQTIQSGQSISVYDQAKATNALVKSLASVINSSVAIGYVTVNPVASHFAGFDVMAKWTGSQFYIFSIPRYSQTTTNQTATFTIPNTGASRATVINESRSISLTNGGTQFVDTFADGNTVHIYRIDKLP